MSDAVAAVRGRVSDHGLRGLDRWFTRELRSTWPLDAALVLSAVLAVVTGAVVVWFHVIFVLVTVAALMLPFSGFVIRFALGVSTSAGLVMWSVASHDLPREELSELPLMSLILVIVYIGAQARARAVSDLERAQHVLTDRTELELDGLRHQLHQAQRLEMLGRASTTMAHDLRNVFVVVGGAASELSQQHLVDDELATHAKEILDATDRGIAIIGDLMTMGRQHDEVGQPIDLVFAIRQYEQLLRRLTPRNVSLRVLSTSEPIMIRVDRTSLLQILMNLIVNAADAIVGSGEITITVQEVIRHQPGGAPRACAQLIVRDDGAGINPVTIANVFESGFSTKSGEHSGLGLATVHQIVQHFKGSIELESSAGAGTSVHICLPLHDERHSTTPGAQVERERRRLTVVDDGGASRTALAGELAIPAMAASVATDHTGVVTPPWRPVTQPAT